MTAKYAYRIASRLLRSIRTSRVAAADAAHRALADDLAAGRGLVCAMLSKAGAMFDVGPSRFAGTHAWLLEAAIAARRCGRHAAAHAHLRCARRNRPRLLPR